MSRYIVQHRRGTVAQWQQKDTIIPQEGEIVIEIDYENSLHKLKIGDGIHTYAELAYLQAGDEIVTQVLTKALPRVVTVTLDIGQWKEITCETNPNLGYYGQTIALDGITKYSRLDLQPSVEMLAEFQQLGLAFTTENNGGTITVCTVGNMPLKTYTMQATIVETECEKDVVVGTPVGVGSIGGGGDGAGYNIGAGLTLNTTTNTLSVNTTNIASQDNTQPITSGGVYEIIGNINAILETI